jgi:hypothetical protein
VEASQIRISTYRKQSSSTLNSDSKTSESTAALFDDEVGTSQMLSVDGSAMLKESDDSSSLD